MDKTYNIEIGNKILINKIGVIIGFIGTIMTIFITLTILSIFLFPNENSVIYLIEFFENKIYLIFLISIVLSITGMRISKIRRYKLSKLTIDKEKISIQKNGKIIEIPEERIFIISECKKRFSKFNYIKIKTDTFKEYHIKLTERALRHLAEFFPDKNSVEKSCLK